MSLRRRFKLPKEHGAWAMLYIPFAIGTLVGSSLSWRLLLLLISVTFFFIARESVLTWWRARTRGIADVEARRYMIAYFALAGLSGAPLILFYNLYWVAAFGLAALLLVALNAQQAVHREDRTIGGEMLAIAGLTLTAPVAYYASRRVLDPAALWLWMLCVLYFGSSVFYVKLRVCAINQRKEDAHQRSVQHCVFYHVFLLAGLLILALTGDLNLFAVAAFLPVLLRSFRQAASPVRQVNLRRVGWLELIYSIVFMTFTTLTFRF
jgi:hypothetical protein